MKKPGTYVGLDLAEKAGVAIYFAFSEVAHVREIKGSPLVQEEIIGVLLSHLTEPVVCFELLQHFRNAHTTRDIMGRYGYIKWNLIKKGFTIREISHQVARSRLKCKSKEEVLAYYKQFHYEETTKLTDNHTDALAIAMYAAYLDSHDFNCLDIEVLNG